LLEFYELLKDGRDNNTLQSAVRLRLEEIIAEHPRLEGLIADGLRLC